ncbi:MAG: hypothetical protein A3J27_03445 [Candidatus Tectomicrobia bacterium RIFCSPLOWO2_12_FULL_69_37]|nr:MAG: hypothetical protein A3I72_16045 [Candidatus Tectomicrobia bacterium RIFCSPLOWO2_02_FULL_70_19]OGL62312.1 MAG: hypothetical protein A3J27_03445 [Candidatus Tectomicrobia bacterium RIFCSPLOWO2_12_FULL_69_37]
MPQFSLRPDTTKYEPRNALSLALASRLAYEEGGVIEGTVRNDWNFPRFHFFSKRETQGFIAGNDQAVLAAFRGTQPNQLQDWMTDADVAFVEGPAGHGEVHAGFARALGYVWEEVSDKIAEFQGNAQSLWFAGHSLGAALATLAVAKLRLERDKPVYGLYTFGQPRTGDREFARIFDADFKEQSFRFVNNNDIVTRVPLREWGYSHVGRFLYFDVEGNIHDDLHWWYRFLDRVKGRVEDLGKMGPDGIKDHDMRSYIANLEKNQGFRLP